MCVCTATPTFAYNYTFGSGADSNSVFGNPTSYDEPTNGDPLSSNERRNKDAAVFAPPYGIFSGEIPTDNSSPYHSNTPLNPWSGSVVISDGAMTAGIPDFGTTSPSFDVPTTNGGLSSLNGSTAEPPPGLLASTSMTAAYNITPWFYEDGSIGSIYIPKINKTMKVYDGESLENMKKGIGRFTSTSAWDGNVGLAGHNRGASAYFSFVKDLEIGDTITYTTLYGERTYKIMSKEQVHETDTSALGYTDGTKNYLFSVNTITVNLEREVVNRSIMVGVGRFFETEADRNIALTAVPTVINGRTLISVRDLAECLYATVEWDNTSRTVIITSGEVPYYDGQGLENRDILFEQMRMYYKISGTLTRLGEEPTQPQTNATVNQTPTTITEPSTVITSAPEVGSILAKILLPGKTDVHTADSYYEAYKKRVGYGCNWYAYGRFYEVHGYQNPIAYTGGETYLDTVENSNSALVRAERSLDNIAAGSIAVYWRQKNGGHVVFVEYVEYDKNGKPSYVYYTECMNSDKSGTYRPATDGKVKKVTFERFKKSSSGTKDLMGYIVPIQ